MVFVLDRRKRPLMPCSEKRARLLLARGRAVVHRMYPFTIRLRDRDARDSCYQNVRIKLDPGSQVTGVAVVREAEGSKETQSVLFLAELQHRGHGIRDALAARRALRRGRRHRKTRYRAARFDNRTRAQGWLAPSLQHRVDSIAGWVRRLLRLAPVTALSQELVRFDTQELQNPEVSGVEYQQGTLAGYEVREYLLEKWDRTCAYCGAKDVALEVEHIIARSRGGSNRVSNLTLACRACNEDKGNQPVEVFLAEKPKELSRIKAQAKAPLKDAAALNSTRWALFRALSSTELPVEVGTGGRTKFNRATLGVPKSHALDAACVGEVSRLALWSVPTLSVKCTGRGSYKRTRLNKHGFPRGYLLRQKQVKGFQTGDMVRAVVPSGKHAGVHRGRVAVRASGSFNLQTTSGTIQGISYRHCRIVQRGDGYGYSQQPKIVATDRRSEKRAA